MSLQDLIRECTAEARASTSHNEAELVKAEFDLNQVQRKVADGSAEVESKHAAIEDRKRRATTMERDLEDARRVFEEKKRQLEKAQDEVHEAEEAAGIIRKDRKLAVDEEAELKRRIEELREQRVQFDELATKSHKEAFVRYTSALEGFLNHLTEQQKDRQARVSLLQRLDEAKKRDAELAHLLEARDELRKILKTATVSLVKDALTRQLNEAEEKLEKIFPGASKADPSVVRADEEVVELFFSHFERDSRTRIFMPFFGSLWDRIEAEGEGNLETICLKIAWEVSKEFSKRDGNSAFSLANGHNFVVLEIPFNDQLSKAAVSVSHGELAPMTLMFSPLPESVQRSIENSQ